MVNTTAKVFILIQMGHGTKVISGMANNMEKELCL